MPAVAGLDHPDGDRPETYRNLPFSSAIRMEDQSRETGHGSQGVVRLGRCQPCGWGPRALGRSRREAMGGKKGHSNMRLAPERVARIQLRCRRWVGESPPDIRLLSVQSASPQATSAAG
jgi:hypothetical protein